MKLIPIDGILITIWQAWRQYRF